MPRPGLDPAMMRFLLDLPKERRDSLLKLSDEELAELGPEELERALKTNENYLAVKKAGKDVEIVLSEEQFNAAVAQKRAESGNYLTLEEAANLVNIQLGHGSPKPFNVIQPSEKRPFEKVMEDLMLQQMEKMLTPPGAGGDKPKTDGIIVKDIMAAQAGGVEAIYVPGVGTVRLNPPPKEGGVGTEIMKQFEDWFSKKIPSLLEPPPGGGLGGLTPLELASQSPEMVRVFLEDKRMTAKDALELEGAKSRNATIKAFSDVVGAIMKPGGLDAFKGAVNWVKAQQNGTEESPAAGAQAPPEVDKFPPFECANPKCKHIQNIQRGMTEYVCDQCGETNEDLVFD